MFVCHSVDLLHIPFLLITQFILITCNMWIVKYKWSVNILTFMAIYYKGLLIRKPLEAILVLVVLLVLPRHDEDLMLILKLNNKMKSKECHKEANSIPKYKCIIARFPDLVIICYFKYLNISWLAIMLCYIRVCLWMLICEGFVYLLHARLVLFAVLGTKWQVHKTYIYIYIYHTEFYIIFWRYKKL